MAEVPENVCDKYHTKSGDTKQTEKECDILRGPYCLEGHQLIPQCVNLALKTLVISGAAPATQQDDIPHEMVPRCSPKAISVYS